MKFEINIIHDNKISNNLKLAKMSRHANETPEAEVCSLTVNVNSLYGYVFLFEVYFCVLHLFLVYGLFASRATGKHLFGSVFFHIDF